MADKDEDKKPPMPESPKPIESEREGIITNSADKPKKS